MSPRPLATRARAILERQAAAGDASARFVLAATHTHTERIARTGCRFGCAELPHPSPYCPEKDRWQIELFNHATPPVA